VIVTLTPNPSVDRTVEVLRLRRGAVMRARAARVDAGGKGVNVSRALAANGHKSLAVLPIGGAEGVQLTALLVELGVDIVPVPISQSVRANVAIVEPDGTTTKVNEPGPRLRRAEVTALICATIDAARDGGHAAPWLALCGSLPPGTPSDLYLRLVVALRGSGIRVAVDSSGPAFLKTLGAGPDLVKPNREELAEVVGRPLETLGDVVDASQQLRTRGVATVLASLGADGAVLVGAAGVLYGEAPVAEPRSTVGAGDAMLAGYLSTASAGASNGARAALVEALAWGAAATSLSGSRMPEPADLDRAAVRVHDVVDRNRPLKGA